MKPFEEFSSDIAAWFTLLAVLMMWFIIGIVGGKVIF